MKSINMRIKRFGRLNAEEKGFSLIEILVAMTILSVGLLALAQMQVIAMKRSESLRVRGNVMAIAQQEMEEVMDADWDDIDDLTRAVSVTRNGITCSLNTDAKAIGVPAIKTRIVEVAVTWTDRNIQKTYTMETVKSEAEELQQ